MVKNNVNLKGMTCGHCISAIEGSVGKLPGVNSVKVNLDSGTVAVEFNPDEVTLDSIKETIDDQGYDVQ
ncbi:copper chaperone CopZ [Peribacillus sp. JNUCC41]|uniref:copper chaperone CopZ n=1 Tax=Peribacillus sp. JNUCC41 TaxID=2778370 RepID=UPI00178589C4|nr:copper chaperone CopZ [Brevibacillus sp. JNUCC-41]QOS89328.1 copper chaperone CopZ [Brevibacillus sp. JNUCC-41]